MAKRNEGRPYLVDAALHHFTHGAVGESMDTAIDKISMDIMGLVNSHWPQDIPLIAAIFRMSANALLEITGDEGKDLCQKIMERTTTVAVQYNPKDGLPKNPRGGGESS